MIGDILREVVKQLVPSERRGITGLLPEGWVPATAGIRTDFDTLSREGYEKNALVYACVNELASSASEAKLVVEQRKGKEWIPNPDHGLQILLDNPNPLMSAYEFWFNVMLYLSLAGKCFWEMEPSGAGRIVGLWLMRPDLVEIEAVRVLLGERTRKKIAGFKWYGQTGSIVFPSEKVLYFRHPHPRDELEGFPPLAAAARAGDTDNFATDFVQAFFKNAAVPCGMFAIKGGVTDPETKKEIKDRLRQLYGVASGQARWFDPMVIDADETNWIQMGSSFTDMDFPQLRRIVETRICAVFQVPPSLVGAFVAMERGSLGEPAYKTARKSFWQETLMPIYNKNAGIINRQLAPLFGRDVRVVWDFTEVEALQEEKTARWTRAQGAFSAGMITRNMALEEIGEERIEGQDVFLQPVTSLLIPAEEQQMAEAVDQVAQAWVGTFKEATQKRFKEEGEALLEVLRKEGKASLEAVPFEIFLRAAAAFFVVSEKKWMKDFLPLFAGISETQAGNIPGLVWDVESPEVQSFLMVYSKDFAGRMVGTNEAKLQGIVMTAQSEDWSVPDIRKAIKEAWDGFDAEHIARMETLSLSRAFIQVMNKEVSNGGH